MPVLDTRMLQTNETGRTAICRFFYASISFLTTFSSSPLYHCRMFTAGTSRRVFSNTGTNEIIQGALVQSYRNQRRTCVRSRRTKRASNFIQNRRGRCRCRKQYSRKNSTKSFSAPWRRYPLADAFTKAAYLNRHRYFYPSPMHLLLYIEYTIPDLGTSSPVLSSKFHHDPLHQSVAQHQLYRGLLRGIAHASMPRVWEVSSHAHSSLTTVVGVLTAPSLRINHRIWERRRLLSADRKVVTRNSGIHGSSRYSANPAHAVYAAIATTAHRAPPITDIMTYGRQAGGEGPIG